MPSIFTATFIQVIVAILFFVSLLYGQRDLTFLTFLVLGVIGGARLWTRFAFASLECHLMIDKRRVFPGEHVTLTIRAENAKPLPIWLEVQVRLDSLLQNISGERIFARACTLLWYERTEFQCEFTAERRGFYQIGHLDIQAGDIFSFFSRRRQIAESQNLIIYPKLVSLKLFSLPRRDFFGTPRAKSPVPDPIYILGTRDYQERQPSKYIHWKASARHNQLQEKVFESTVQEKVLLVADVEAFAQHAAAEDFERTLEVIASLAVRFEKRGHAVGFVTNGVAKGKNAAIVPVSRNDMQLAGILEILACLEMKPASAMKNALREALLGTWGVSCIYFSYQNDETVFSANSFLGQSKIPAQFIVCHRESYVKQDHLWNQPRIRELTDLWTQEVVES